MQKLVKSPIKGGTKEDEAFAEMLAEVTDNDDAEGVEDIVSELVQINGPVSDLRPSGMLSLIEECHALTME